MKRTGKQRPSIYCFPLKNIFVFHSSSCIHSYWCYLVWYWFWTRHWRRRAAPRLRTLQRRVCLHLECSLCLRAPPRPRSEDRGHKTPKKLNFIMNLRVCSWDITTKRATGRLVKELFFVAHLLLRQSVPVEQIHSVVHSHQADLCPWITSDLKP